MSWRMGTVRGAVKRKFFSTNCTSLLNKCIISGCEMDDSLRFFSETVALQCQVSISNNFYKLVLVLLLVLLINN